MGSLVRLGVGKFEADWSKNWRGTDHRPLFQVDDRSRVPYFYAENKVVEKFGYARPLRHVRERLDLLGFSMPAVRQQYNGLLDCPEFRERNDLPGFEDLRQRFAVLDVTRVPPEFGDDDRGFGEFFAERIFPVAYSGDCAGLAHKAGWSWGEDFYLHPWAVLRLLAENPNNLDEDVVWRVMDLVEGGYSDASEFVPCLPRSRRFLIVTEGTSDAKVLKHAFALLMPQIADFFCFVDMGKGYPFSGTGNLFRFSQGLASIGILNRVVVVYDNDAEGYCTYANTCKLALPENLRCIRLPDHPHLASFPTVGPQGDGMSNINGCGASIECYLDHRSSDGRRPQLRWTNYVPAVNRWQGALERKEEYVRAFLSLRHLAPGYDFSRLRAVLGSLITQCRELGALEIESPA